MESLMVINNVSWRSLKPAKSCPQLRDYLGGLQCLECSVCLVDTEVKKQIVESCCSANEAWFWMSQAASSLSSGEGNSINKDIAHRSDIPMCSEGIRHGMTCLAFYWLSDHYDQCSWSPDMVNQQLLCTLSTKPISVSLQELSVEVDQDTSTPCLKTTLVV